MAEMDDRINPDNYLGVIRAALDPDERKFFKEYLGQDSPGVMDYLAPQGRFGKARDLREDIVKNVLTQALQPRATVGEAQALFPDMPVPPNAIRSQNVPLQGPGIPIEKPIPTPADPDLFGGTGMYEPDQMRNMNAYKQRTGAFFDEGEQPMGSMTGVDPNALLPRSFQNVVNARTQAMVHPRQAGAGITDAMVKMQTRTRLQQLRSGQKELYPGETRDIEQELGFYDKAPMPGSAGARKEGAEASIAEAKVPYAGQREASALLTDEVQRKASNAQANLASAHTDETNLLMEAKLRKLIAETELAQTQGGQVGQRANNAEELLKLREAAHNLDKAKVLFATGAFTPEAQGIILSGLAEGIVPGFKANTEDRTLFQRLFNKTPKVGGTVGPMAAPPLSGAPQQPGTEAPAEQPATPKAPPTWAKGMKDGESRKSPDGKTYRRKGNKLELVP